ncbi:MAG: polysaccharide biosynthesis C-terminal domain-containing protein [Ferruginibacter sp.]
MGIIQKQGLRSSVFLMIGFVIGAINLLFLFPKVLSQEEIGLTRALIDAGTVLSVLATLGTVPVIYKFYPYYKALGRRNDLAYLTGMICLVGFIIICLLGFFFNDFIVRKLGKSPLFASNVILVYPLTLLMLSFTWMEAFGWALKKAVVTNFLKETLVRIITTILILLAWAGAISKGTFVNYFSLIYFLPVIILATVLLKSGDFTFTKEPSRVTTRFKDKMFTFGLFVFGATFLNVASRTVDSFMIIGLKGLAETAIFTYAAYLGAFMDLPLRSINSVATPILSESWKDKKYTNIATVYRKSTITLLVAGLFIFLIALLSINNLVSFLGKGWEQVPAIFLIMGLAKIVDLGTGVNGQIISTSSNWRFDFYTNVMLTVVAFPLNFFLIKYFGIIGAAFSNLAAIIIFNGVRFSFIYKKYGWQPYGFVHVKIILVSALIFIAVYEIPFIINIYIDTVFRSVLFSGLFVPAMLRMNVSEEFSLTARNFLNKVRRR